jgi:type IV secretory pathway VirB9-like protein
MTAVTRRPAISAITNIKIKKLNKEVKFNFNKTLYVVVSDHLIYIIIAYLNVLVLKALTHKIATNINML